ncbi:MAG: hypothetical protein ACLRTA_08415 [Clostridia bacterium]
MHDYEIFIEETAPLRWRKHSQKALIEAGGCQPGSLCKRKWKISDSRNYNH